MASSTCVSTLKAQLSHTSRTHRRQLHSGIKKQAPATASLVNQTDPGAVRSSTVLVKPTELAQSPLARLPTSSILRSLFLSVFFTSPLLFKPGLAVFSAIADSNSAILNADRNPVLRRLIKPLVYDQFCAGRDQFEIGKTSKAVRDLGFSGIILCYGKEVQLDADESTQEHSSASSAEDAEIAHFRNGNLETLRMIGKGDWLGIKMTGAGRHVTDSMAQGKEAPPKFVEAMDDICKQAAAQDIKIYIDAEQQAVQKSIDEYTFDLMRKYNIEKALVYSTIQAYLKKSRNKVQRQLDLASKEGWVSGIKLVRGAYIASDKRELIHDTKTDTDVSYDGIVEDLLRGQNFPVFSATPDMKHELLLAGHNSTTIRRATQLATKLAASSKLKTVPVFAQLQGMADDVGCELAQLGEEVSKNQTIPAANVFVPKVFKCLTWGTITECMQYLTRRLVENRGAADRMKVGATQLRSELWRRMKLSR